MRYRLDPLLRFVGAIGSVGSRKFFDAGQQEGIHLVAVAITGAAEKQTSSSRKRDRRSIDG